VNVEPGLLVELRNGARIDEPDVAALRNGVTGIAAHSQIRRGIAKALDRPTSAAVRRSGDSE
jgi:hypothetical protein